MTEIRNTEGHLIFCSDAERGVLERRVNGKKESIEIHLPRGGEVIFSRGSVSTYIRRLETGVFYAYSFPSGF